MAQRSNGHIDLAGLAVFHDLDNALLEALSQCAVSHRLVPGDVLYHQGEMAESFFVVKSGAVRLIENTIDGQVMNLKVYGPGDIFGLLSVSGSYPHPSEVHATDESEVIALSGSHVRDLMFRFPELAVRVLDLLIAHIHHAHERLRQMAVERVEQRLARAMVLFAAKFGEVTGEGIAIDLSLSQRQLAEYTGTSVETVNRTLKNWEQRGIIVCSRQHVDILAHDQLLVIAG